MQSDYFYKNAIFCLRHWNYELHCTLRPSGFFTEEMDMRKLCGLVLALALLPGVANASLIVNGGFETGNFSGWTQSGNLGFTSVSNNLSLYVHSGSFGASFGPIGSLGYIEQTIATTAGGTYQLSFWLRNLSGSPVNQFVALWDGATVTSLTNSAAFGFTQFTYNLVAVDSSTVVKFGFQHDPNFFGFDDVSLNAVPVPTGVVMAGVGIVCLGGFSYFRRRRVVLSV